MNAKTNDYITKVAKVIESNKKVTKAVVFGNALDDNFNFEDNIYIAIFTKADNNFIDIFSDLNEALVLKNLAKVDLYMMSDPDFYVNVIDELESGKVIVNR